MADELNQKDLQGSDNGAEAVSDLESLKKKYGFSDLDENIYSRMYSSPREKYSPVSPYTQKSSLHPKNNNPAYAPGSNYSGGYQDSSPQGPQGKRVIYSEPETEPIYLKRQRNANLPKKTVKGSVGFGSQPYVKHVASSQTAIKQDDASTFSRTYEKTISDSEKKSDLTDDVLINVKGKSRLVAANQEAEAKKRETQSHVHAHYVDSPKDKFVKGIKTIIPWKGDPAKEVIRKIIMDISAILVLVCFGYFIDNYIQHQKQLENQNNLQNLYTESATDDLDAQWAAIKAKYPDIDFPDGMNIKYAELYAKNQDLIGWLNIPGTNIDTCVLQRKQDLETDAEQDFYLRHNFYGEYDKYGNAYLDRYNTGETLDRNNTIYGHNMTDGLAFAQLEKYYTIDGFKESPVIRYSTLFEDYYFKVYAVIITNGYPEADNGYLFNYNVTGFSSKESFLSFIEALDERKLYDTGVDINENDVLITLSTCSYEIKATDMGRLAVIGRMVRKGESTSVDTSKAVMNDNVRYPQIWYDEHNLSNPYADAYQWKP